jgi:hypothetical protein
MDVDTQNEQYDEVTDVVLMEDDQSALLDVFLRVVLAAVLAGVGISSGRFLL